MIHGHGTNECPVSLVTEWSRAVVDMAHRSSLLDDVLSLPRIDDLPAKVVDALEVVAVERARTNSMMTVNKEIQDSAEGS